MNFSCNVHEYCFKKSLDVEMKVKGAKNAALQMNIFLPINSFQKLLGVENLFPALLKMAILLSCTCFFLKVKDLIWANFCMNFILYQEWHFYWYNLSDSSILIGSTSNVSTYFLLNFSGVCLPAISRFWIWSDCHFFQGAAGALVWQPQEPLLFQVAQVWPA